MATTGSDRPYPTAHELWADLAKAGFVGVNLPEQYGGGGAGLAQLSVVCEEVAAAGCPLLLLLVSPAICGSVIARFDAWVLRGSKTFISGVDGAEAILVVARTGIHETTGRAELSLFIVDADAPGLERQLLELARLTTWRAAELYDDGADAGEAANMAKFAAAEAALACVDRAIQTHGGNGMTTESGIASRWGMARLLRIAPVSREMILNFVAQHSLSLPRSY